MVTDDLNKSAENIQTIQGEENEPSPVEDALEPDEAVTDSSPDAEDAAQTDEETTLDLPAQLEEARAQAAEYLEGWQRARAEFTNYRKRVEREREETFRHATTIVLERLLPIIDDLERAMDNIPADISKHTWAQGVTLIGHKLQTLLESSGLEAIDPLGETFDPTRHEAIGTDDNDDVESGHVTAVLQKGYVHGDKVLRPALVRVAD